MPTPKSPRPPRLSEALLGLSLGPGIRREDIVGALSEEFLEMAQTVQSATLGDLTILGHPVSHNGKRNPLRCAAPELGHNNEEILTSLGYSQTQVADLEQRGII